MMLIGDMKNGIAPMGAFALAAVLSLGSIAVHGQTAQPGPEMKGWSAPDKPGDGKVEVVLSDGADPHGCRLAISAKGASCTKIMCKGEQAIFTNSSQSIMAAKKISLSVAKAHYVHFLQEEINSKRTTDMIDAAIKKEGGPDAATTATSGYVSSQNIREQAGALIKGFAVVEDGVTTDESGGKVAYTIGGVSCATQQAADSQNAGHRTDSSTGQQQGAQSNSEQRGQQVNNSRRKAVDGM